MNYRIPAVVAIMLFLTAAGAQETATPGPAAPKAEAAHVDAGKAADEEPVRAPPPDAKATGPSPDTFTPSEEISEDLSVSFPVDI